MLDEVRLTITAGNGGDGHVSFRREKYIRKGGPDGGDGGDGGSIIIKSNPNLNTLNYYAGKRVLTAPDGEHGGKSKKTGKNGDDVTYEVPVGTTIIDARTNNILVDLDTPNTTYTIARGGTGGRGNWSFRTSTHQSPTESEQGTAGESKDVIFRLKLIAEVGFMGFPNAGKSTLLSVITRAKPKIANYPFTTLSPNLGVLKISDRIDSIIIADIPGIIEGASKGKGLGTKFLQHIERCNMLVYVIFPEEGDLELDGMSLAKKMYIQYKQLRTELKDFNNKMLALPHITVLNKIDLLSDSQIQSITQLFNKQNQRIMCISAITKQGLDRFKETLLSQ